VGTSEAQPLTLAAGWTVVQVTGPAVPVGMRLWCSHVGRLLLPGQVVVCDLRQLAGADLTTLDAVARLKLAARRAGSDLRVLAAGTELERLWEWAGLGKLPGAAQPGARQPETVGGAHD
jgi:hypothetical protein